MRVLGPQRQKAAAERRPKGLDLLEYPTLIGDAVVFLCRVPGLRVPAEKKIAEKRAQIEPDRAIEGEFRIDDSRVSLGHHDGAGVEIAVDERLYFVEELPSELRGRHFEPAIGSQVRNDPVKLRRSVAVALAAAVWVTEDQVHRDAHQLFVAGEERDSIHLLLEGAREVGGEEARARNVLANVAGDVRVTAPCDQTLPQDDVRR